VRQLESADFLLQAAICLPPCSVPANLAALRGRNARDSAKAGVDVVGLCKRRKR
jgi:hypothetical protein